MWILMVLNIIAIFQSAQGGYEYPKPRIPFELPNQYLQNSEGQTLKTNNIYITKTLDNFLPNDDYRHSQQYTNEEQIQSSVLKTLQQNTVQSEQQNFEVGIKQDYPDLNPTQFNAHVDSTVTIQNAVPQSSVIKDLNSVKQPVLSTNCPELIVKIKNNVPPLVSLQNSKNELLNNLRLSLNEPDLANFNIHQVENVLPLVNLNINQVGTVNENNIRELTNVPQQNEYIDTQSFQQSHQNENSGIRSNQPIVQDFVPNVLNILNSVQPYSGEFNKLVDIQENKDELSNLNTNVEQTQFNVQSSQVALHEEPGLLNNRQSSLQSLSVANIATPVITKSISFHVPPPDIEEKSVVPAILPPRKTYKIIFVKAPTYENSYNQQLQANLLSRLAPVEEKTIVYVLSKKPEVTEQVVQPLPTKVSEHEVLYVQYKGDSKIDSEHINENVSQLPINSAGAVFVEPRHLDDH